MGQSSRLQGSGAFSIATGLGAGPQTRGAGRRVRRPARCGGWIVSDDKRSGPDPTATAAPSTTSPRKRSRSSRRASTRAVSTRRSSSASMTPPGLCSPGPRRGHGPLARLYRGETRFDFVGRRKIWFSISTAIIVLGIISIVLRGGLNLGIDFKGGYEWTIQAPGVTQTQATDALKGTGVIDPTVQLLGTRGPADDQRAVGPEQAEPGPADAVSTNVQKALVEVAAAHTPKTGPPHAPPRRPPPSRRRPPRPRRAPPRGIHHDLGAHDDDHVGGQQPCPGAARQGQCDQRRAPRGAPPSPTRRSRR